MSKKAVILLMSFFLCMINSNRAFAQEQINGRIIEINRDLDVVFINRGKGVLSIGDVVKIYDGDKFVSYLKVVQLLDKVAALSSFQDEDFSSDMISFDEVHVGNTFVKASAEDHDEPKSYATSEDISSSDLWAKAELERKEKPLYRGDDIKTSSGEIQEMEETQLRISKHLEKMIKRNRVLEEERDEINDRIGEIKKDMEDLKNENLFLKSKLKKTGVESDTEMDNILREKEKYRYKAEELNRKLLVVKEKLNKMENLIDRM